MSMCYAPYTPHIPNVQAWDRTAQKDPNFYCDIDPLREISLTRSRMLLIAT